MFTKLTLSDPEADAERLYDLSQAYRSEKKEIDMLTAIEKVAEKYPKSYWTDEALMAAGNYYWVQLDRAKALATTSVFLMFPAGKNAYNSEWRVAWLAYLASSAFRWRQNHDFPAQVSGIGRRRQCSLLVGT